MSETTQNRYMNGNQPSWCPGCSYFTVLSALTECFDERGIAPDEICVISGIGCSSRLPLFLNTHGMHTLHGRPLPVAIGSRLARPDIPVIVATGDGDLLSIGAAHFVHAARKNFDLTVICLDNRLYAMTKNQTSPTSPLGYQGSLTPYGKLSAPLNTTELAISSGASMVCRSCAYDKTHVKKMIDAAMSHRGFSLVDVIAPCRTFGDQQKEITERLYDLQEKGHKFDDRESAMRVAAQTYDSDIDENAGIPVGVVWKRDDMLCFDDQVKRVLTENEGKYSSINDILDEFRPGAPETGN
jgi:2-oxoglutarate/2-oxoacid ferredoxin oxidoreductase subunit beta